MYIVFIALSNNFISRKRYLPLNNEQLYTFLVICGFIAGALFTVMDTLLNPVLSDHFGFTIADSSYFVFGVTCILVMGAGIL